MRSSDQPGTINITMPDLVSVIVLTYNSEKYVVETLESIKSQTYHDIELVISDDCSTDSTIDICRYWTDLNAGRFIRTKIVSKGKNSGIPANCNQGITNSTGKWIKLIAGDDLLFTDSIEIFMSEVKADLLQEKKIFHGRLKSFSEANGEIINDYSEWGAPTGQKFNSKDITATEQFSILLRFCPVAGPATFIRRDVFEKTGLFDERFRFWEDRPMWLRVTSSGIKFHFVNKDVVNYRVHEGSVQKNDSFIFFSRTLLSKDEGYRAIIIQHLPPAERFLNLYLIGVRKFIWKLSGNRKTVALNIVYKSLSVLPQRLLQMIMRRYSP